MSKKVIVLADNSYTIRRIVELSFSEIENIEVHSYENGSGIKETLLHLNPAVVIVDIKLPEMNGYDICRFINETPALSAGRVFLMKGSFEPVDNEMIKNLKYEDIITKPFDSNALVAAVMKIVNQGGSAQDEGFAAEGPTTFPEEFPEIETESPESEGISFSDIRGEIESPALFARPAPGPGHVEREEIQPSEEITQTQPQRDNLTPQEAEEPLKNPFDEEPAFEEISSAAAAAPSPVALEYEQEPPPPAAGVPVETHDISDDFHDRFLEIANEDTSEDILKVPLEAPLLPDAEGLEFPSDLKEKKPLEVDEKLSLEFETIDMHAPAQTLFAGPKAEDFVAGNRKEAGVKFAEPPPVKAVAREPVAEKAKPETLSPQDELARLTSQMKREVKLEPPTAATAAAQKFAMNGKLEEKLNQSIKELLWEIVPPLAEKLIKEEIDKIKSDLNDSGF